MKRIIDLTVDFQNKMYSTISLKQMDTTEIRVQLLNNNTIVNLTSETVDILFTKPDNTIVQQNASSIDKENGKATIELLPDCLRKSGKAKMEIEIKDSNNELLSSFYIPIQIEQTSKENVISDNTPNYFEEFAQKINKFEKISNQMLENIGLAEEQRNVNEGNRETAEQLRIEAEQKREQEKSELEEETRKTIEELQTELRLTKQDLKAGTLEGENTGESLYLQDSSDARFRSFEIGGNSKQETREESNLYDKSTNITSKAVDINGEEYSSPGWALTDYIPILAVNKLLKYSGLTAVGNRPHSAFYDADKNFISSFKQAVGENTLEIPTNASYVRFTIEVASGDINTFNVSYVAMPSLEFPSEIEAVGQDVNIFDSSIFLDVEQNGVKIERNSDGTLTLNGTYTGTTSWVYRFDLPTPIVTNTKEQLYLTMQKIKGDCTGQIRFTVWEPNSDNRWLSFETDQYADLLKEKTYDRASIIIYAGATFDNLTIGLKISNKKEAIYSSYNHGSANVTVCNRNLCDNIFEQGTIDVSNGKDGTWNNTKYIRTKNYIKIKPNTIYTMTNAIQNRGRKTRFYDKDKNYLGHFPSSGTILAQLTDTNLKRSATMPDNAYYMRFELDFDDAQTGQDVIDGKYKYQLEEGETATDYIAHEEQTLTMTIQQEMLEGDYFDLDNEEEVHTWGKKIFNGTEACRMPAMNDKNAVFTNLADTVIYDFMSDTLEQLSTHFTWKGAEIGYQQSLDKGIGMYTYITSRGKYAYFVVPLEIASTLSEWTNWLTEQFNAGKPLTIYYKLETPTKLPFTEAQKVVAKQIRETLHTYKNGTHVYSVDAVSPIFNAKYTRDQETYIKNEINKMQAMILAE